MTEVAERPLGIAAENLVHELMAVTLEELKHAQDVWQKLSADEQDAVIARVDKRVRTAAREALEEFSAHGLTRVQASIESITVKDGIKAVLSLSKSDAGRHELIDAQGGKCTVVLAPISAWTDGKHGHKADAPQRELELGSVLGSIANSEAAKPTTPEDGAPATDAGTDGQPPQDPPPADPDGGDKDPPSGDSDGPDGQSGGDGSDPA